MKISKNQLIEMGFYRDGLQRFTQQTNNTDEPVDVVSLIGGKTRYMDILWILAMRLPKSKIIRFAIDCALINIGSDYKSCDYDNDYELITDFANTPKKTNLHARYSAKSAHTAFTHDYAYFAYVSDSAAYAAGVNAKSKEKVNQLLVELIQGA